ncbi:MAG: hypothetical protein AAF944_20480 [Bacteroidota bacterium]
MKKLLISIVLLIGCRESAKQEERVDTNLDTTILAATTHEHSTPTIHELNDFIDPAKFNVAKQDSFSLENWYYGTRQDGLVELTTEEIKKYFQDSDLKNDLDDSSRDEYRGSYYYFSVQENSKNKVVITIIEEYDYCCADLYLMTYNQENRLVGKSKVAGTGGDGGWGFDEYGHFISDSIFQLFRVEESTIRDDQDTMEYKIDSLITRFAIDKNLNFKKLNEREFQRNKIVVN